jgi:hypothetical protein
VAQRRQPRRGLLTDSRVRREILELADQGVSPVEIERRLREIRQFIGLVPARRTIQHIARARTGTGDTTAVWSMENAPAEDVRVLLPVVAVVVEQTHGRVQGLTELEASWILKLRRSSDDLDPWLAYRLARRILVAANAGKPTKPFLDFLAFTPWRDRSSRYLLAWANGWISQFLMFTGVDVRAPDGEVETRALHRATLLEGGARGASDPDPWLVDETNPDHMFVGLEFQPEGEPK